MTTLVLLYENEEQQRALERHIEVLDRRRQYLLVNGNNRHSLQAQGLR